YGAEYGPGPLSRGVSSFGCCRGSVLILPVDIELCVRSGRSALALLVARVALADHHDAAVTTNHLAVIADGLDARADLHSVSCSLSSYARECAVTSRPISGSGRRCGRV